MIQRRKQSSVVRASSIQQKYSRLQLCQQEQTVSDFVKFPTITLQKTGNSTLSRYQSKAQGSQVLSDNFAIFQIFPNQESNQVFQIENSPQIETNHGILSKYHKLKSQEINLSLKDDTFLTSNGHSNFLKQCTKDQESLSISLVGSKSKTIPIRNVEKNIGKTERLDALETSDDSIQNSPPVKQDTKQLPQKRKRRQTLGYIYKCCDQEELPKRSETTNQLISALEIDNHQKQKYFIHKKFRKILLVVQAALRFSCRRRLQQKKIKQEFEALKKQRQPHFKYVNTFSGSNLKREYMIFVRQVSSKIIQYFQSQNYIEETKQIYKNQNELNEDLKQTRFCALSKLFFQNLELLTRKENIPQILLHKINDCMFKQNNTETSYFIYNKCQYYSKNILKLTQEQKMVISIDFFVFQVIIPSIILQMNDFLHYDQAHQQITQFHCVGIASLIQYLYVNKFQELKNLNNPNGKLISKAIMVKQEQNKIINYQFENTEQIPENNQIFIGSISNEYFDKLFEVKQKWKIKVKKLFQQIITNLTQQINV